MNQVYPIPGLTDQAKVSLLVTNNRRYINTKVSWSGFATITLSLERVLTEHIVEISIISYKFTVYIRLEFVLGLDIHSKNRCS